MPNWFINSVAAQILHERHGLSYAHLNTAFLKFYGNYWYDFEACQLRRHPPLVRQPKYQLSIDDVLALIVMPKEARDAYIEATGTPVSFGREDSI